MAGTIPRIVFYFANLRARHLSGCMCVWLLIARRLGAISFFCLAVACAAAGVSGQPTSSAPPGPPVPFEDAGACPFEGCVYREWIATAPVTVRAERRLDSRVLFTVRAGDRIAAVTGVVVTTKPGRVQFARAADLESASGRIHVEPGDMLYLLTYQGEGFSKAWFKGRLYDGVDGTGFFSVRCESQPRCTGTLVEQPQRIWWVQLRNAGGVTGWTNEPEKFDNKDALAN